MILAIDFGGAVAKVLVVPPEVDKFRVVEVPLGFRTRPHLKTGEALIYVIRSAVGEEKPEAVYASGEIASLELKGLLTKPPQDPVETLKKFGLPLVVVGSEITYFGGRAVRGLDIVAAAEKIAGWLPFEVKISEVQNYFANKEIYPTLVPTTDREMELERAAARVRIEKAIGNRHWALENGYVIASGGAFDKASDWGRVALMLLDALQPTGRLKIYLDHQHLLPALATLAVYEEEKAQEILNQEPFTFLGTTFSVEGEALLQIDLRLSETPELAVPAGELVVFPLDEEQAVPVKLRSSGGEVEFEAGGGPIGLVIDARGRPLELPRGESERIKALKKWEEAVCRHPLFKK